MSRLRGTRLAAAGALVVAFAAGCGSDNDGDDGGQAGGAAVGSDGMTLEITAPEDGATVEVPFTVELASSEELGPTDTGAHHVHVFFDGDDEEYLVVEGDSADITDLPDGEHVVNASLRNADHSPAGVETEVSVTVGEGGGGDTEDDGGLPGY